LTKLFVAIANAYRNPHTPARMRISTAAWGVWLHIPGKLFHGLTVDEGMVYERGTQIAIEVRCSGV
jgi:hypothetical protein